MSRQKFTFFNPKRLKLPEYSNWLIPVDDSNSAGCKIHFLYIHLAGRGFNKKNYIYIYIYI